MPAANPEVRAQLEAQAQATAGPACTPSWLR